MKLVTVPKLVDYCYNVAVNVPNNYQDAIASSESRKWQKAMEEEMAATDGEGPVQEVKRMQRRMSRRRSSGKNDLGGKALSREVRRELV